MVHKNVLNHEIIQIQLCNNMTDILTFWEESKEIDEKIHSLNSNPEHLTDLMRALGVSPADSEQFLDAWDAWIYEWVFNSQQYAVFKRYLWDVDFIERFTRFTHSANKRLKQDGFTESELWLIWEELQRSVHIMLTKFRIYDTIWNTEEFLSNFRVTCKDDECGSHLVSLDGQVSHLLHWNTLYEAIWYILWAWWTSLKYIIYNFHEGIVIYDRVDESLFHISWKFYWAKQNGDINWILSEEGNDEKLTILETRTSMKRPRIRTKDWEEYTPFHTVHSIDTMSQSALVSYWWLEFTVTIPGWDNQRSNRVWVNWEIKGNSDPIIRRKVYDTLVSLPNHIEIFSTNGKIIDVTEAWWDILVLHESSIYHPDKKDFTTKVLWVFSANEQQDLVKYSWEYDYNLITVNGNYILILWWNDDISIYDLISKTNINQVKDVNIDEGDDWNLWLSYTCKATGEQKYFHTWYSHTASHVNLLTWETVWKVERDSSKLH